MFQGCGYVPSSGQAILAEPLFNYITDLSAAKSRSGQALTRISGTK